MPRPYQIERRTAVASGQPVSAHPEIEHLVMDRPDRGLCASQTVAMSTLFYRFPHNRICIVRIAAMTLSAEYQIVVVGPIAVNTEMTAKGKRTRSS